jgi:Kdo2-lipid IVA lauroyltransferase/acyltransferase
MKNWFEYLVLLLVRFVFRFLPWWLMYKFSDGLFYLCRTMGLMQRGSVQKNVERCFPHVSKQEQQQLVEQCYRLLLDSVFEVVKLSLGSRSIADMIASMRIPAALQAYWDQGKSVVLWSGHASNFCVYHLLNFSTASTEVKRFAGYRWMTNPLLDRVVLRMRERFGWVGIRQNRVARVMKEKMSQASGASAYLLIADQIPHKRQAQVNADFFGQSIPFLLGPELLAQKYAMPMFYARVTRVRRGRYEITFEELEAKSGELGERTRCAAAYLEQDIRRAPGEALGMIIKNNVLHSLAACDSAATTAECAR